MPKTPIDYSKAVIYKIEHMEKPDLLYVGSTTDFIRRKSEHKYICANSNVKNYNLKLYQMIRDNDGWESFKIMIIKEFPCESKIQLIMEEEKYRKELQTTLNSCRAYRTNDEKKQYNIDYHDKNKEKKNEKITCECGCISLKQNMIRHKKSLKHCQFIQN
jgi:predicted GIY-YIG superfamily endonuclease